ncbi:DUF1631 family protein [Marinobacter halodurans]|uniref:DUF1631 family protein n=1 Tax=Marinobacter halodurans TaxID=2528979 RepID=A0ABY1ZJ85_9GAMM|nr:DUF1631 family protein [Marinobacter halodurans]TBW54762.1 DUF1631 family protein [Marinobacter halodurans]
MVQPPARQTGNAQPPHPDLIQAILKGIRVPELPYPVTRPQDDAIPDWAPLLADCWREQQDKRVIDVLTAVSGNWPVRQVNAAYLADRIMDVFLHTSGLHATLVRRCARLRFILAWQIGELGAAAIGPDSPVHAWLDSLHALRGWSDSGGRAARQVSGWLDNLVDVGNRCLAERDLAPFSTFTRDWEKEQAQKAGRIDRLRQRLLETETGAARQRAAEQIARAVVGRALGQRELPPAITSFIERYWLPLLRQVIWSEGLASDNGRHASRLLEWMIWVSDPKLSDRERDKLYHVGEQLSDKINEVWSRVHREKLPHEALQGIEEVMVARLRGTPVDLAPVGNVTFEPRWLNPAPVDPAEVRQYEGIWFVEGEDEVQQRQFFFAYLNDSQEVLWTNGEGVKLGLMSWHDFRDGIARGRLRSLPPINHFGNVVSDTVAKLEQVLRWQVEKRREARAKAEAQAARVREERAMAEQKLQEEEARRLAEAAETSARQEAAERARVEAEQARLQSERLEQARRQVDGLKLGNWIALAPEADAPSQEARKLKLAVRLNATGKLIFVDRLGLNRTEIVADALVEAIAGGQARVMSSEAEFEDTLSRVVGRIRVGR